MKQYYTQTGLWLNNAFSNNAFLLYRLWVTCQITPVLHSRICYQKRGGKFITVLWPNLDSWSILLLIILDYCNSESIYYFQTVYFPTDILQNDKGHNLVESLKTARLYILQKSIPAKTSPYKNSQIDWGLHNFLHSTLITKYLILNTLLGNIMAGYIMTGKIFEQEDIAEF